MIGGFGGIEEGFGGMLLKRGFQTSSKAAPLIFAAQVVE
jgi:hypothetical protein